MTRRARRNALRLALAQALAGANATVVFATAAIVGVTLSPDRSLATLPVSVFVCGMAAGTLPTARLPGITGAGLRSLLAAASAASPDWSRRARS